MNLTNDSVGEYINISDGQMNLCIDDAKDIYFQKSKFKEAYDTVYYELFDMKNRDKLRVFQQKFRDCEVLVMVNDTHNDTQPIEQVFLDINEKSQLLDYEDIFKGHCFKNFTDDSLHQELRQLWAKLKCVGVRFRDFGYKDLSQYIYHYILANVDRNMPENLSPHGVHILSDKTMDETETMLKSMIEYGEKVLFFRITVEQYAYCFTDICYDSKFYNNTNNHSVLKLMAIEILDSDRSVFQKIPFFILIRALLTRNYGENLTHDKLKKIFTNIYIYCWLFVIRGGRKSKGDIDLTIREALSDTYPVQAIVDAAKQMRKGLVDKFEFRQNLKPDDLEFVYSVIDFYNANQNWLKYKYTNKSEYTLEHFIIPDNRGKRVRWRSRTDFEFVITNDRAGEYKRCSCNFIIILKKLNEDIEHDDIISKILAIRNWYKQRNEVIPTHISIFIEHIEALPTYHIISSYKYSPTTTHDEVVTSYNNFIEEYFSDENQSILSMKLQRTFQESFLNNH